jgi:hypothetical protein
MRRAIWATALVVLAAACSGTTEPSPWVPVSATPTLPPKTPLAPPPPSPLVEPVGVPAGTPAWYDDDVEPSGVPPEALVPPGTSVSDVWYAETSAGSSLLVAYVVPGSDPLRQEHGLVVWRRFPGEPEPWRPVFGLHDPPTRGVVQIQAVVGDATGDGSPDALTFEDTGGSGACGTWRVLDLAANARVFKQKACDTTIDLSTDPVGLIVREAVFEEGDAHCCPSATRTSLLVLEGSGWKVYSTTEQPS